MNDIVYDGIDVSSYQKDIDWTTTAMDKNIKFVYVKATEGATYRSRHYEYNIQNARRCGIRVGSYHFFRTTVSVESQFQNFTSIVKQEDQDLVPLIDVETKKGVTAKQLCDSILAFAKLLEDYYGCRPMIYTGSSFYNSYLQGRINGYPLFIARYSKSEPRLAGGAKWTLWQFSERGRINGIDHYVDLCRFNKGCSINDILIKDHRIKGKRNIAKDMPNVPPPRKMEVKEKPVPLSKKEQERQRKAQEKAKEKAKKEAKKKAKQEAEAKRLQMIQRKKQRQEQQQQAERKHRQEQEAKRLKEKQHNDELKKQQEQARKQQEAREREAKRQQDLQRKAEEAKQRKLEELKRQELLKKKKQMSANDRNKTQGKRINGSSADNDD